MSKRDPIQLLDGGTRTAVGAVLIDDVSDAELAASDAAWISFLQPILESRSGLTRGGYRSWLEFVRAAYAAIIASGGSLNGLPENAHWKWLRKRQKTTAGGIVSGIEQGGEMQGLVLTRVDKVSRLTATTGQPIVYVDYLATAPWNQRDVVSVPRFVGCGIALISKAIEQSDARGWGGRIGLHSLTEAEPFYHKCVMTDLGIDTSYEGLRYFEMSGAQGQEFLKRIRQ